MCVVICHSERGLSLNTAPTQIMVSACAGTAVAYTEKLKAHVLALLWLTQNTASACVGIAVACTQKRQAHVLAHLWPTQNTASVCVGTPVAYKGYGKPMSWHSCGLNTTR